MSKRRNYEIMSGDPWQNLAIAIIASGVWQQDTVFLRGPWYRTLCDMLGVDADNILDLIGGV